MHLSLKEKGDKQEKQDHQVLKGGTLTVGKYIRKRNLFCQTQLGFRLRHLSDYIGQVLASGHFQPSTACFGIDFTQLYHLADIYPFSVVMNIPCEGREIDQPLLLLEMPVLGRVQGSISSSFSLLSLKKGWLVIQMPYFQATEAPGEKFQQHASLR